MKYFLPAMLLAGALLVQAGPNTYTAPPIIPTFTGSKPLVNITVPKKTRVTGGGLGIGNVKPKAAAPPRTVDMKLLVLTVDGTEPSYGAITSFLKYLGVPYDAVITKTQPLPVLNDSVKGFYQGIILVTGNLGICDPTCRSALSAEDWLRMDQYAVAFGVRRISYYTFPEARYGLSSLGAVTTSATAPQNGTFLAAASTIWDYLQLATPLKITDAYTYLAAVTPIAGATSTPLITLPGGIIANQFLDSDGSESIALTMDNYLELQHSLLLNYGLIRWVTRGKFIGLRRVYLSPQIDDLFLPNDLYVASIPGCQPTGFTADPTYDPSANCPTIRITSADLTKLAAWEDSIRANPSFPGFRTGFAFNGYGHTADADITQPDTLLQTAVSLGPKFFQVNHTWDHEHLDCYDAVPNSGICRAATYAESFAELKQNQDDAAATGLVAAVERQAIVTPNISGLFNPNFMQAARDTGFRYVVGDTSRPEFVPPVPNTGLWNPYQLILMIPRRANNLFYNVTRPTTGSQGSWPDEFNYFYGPQGIFRVGGTGGPPFFTSNLTYAQLLDFEASALVRNMLKYEIYPVMFHQANVFHYDGVNSVYRDLISKTKEKYLALVKTPVTSLSETDTGIAIIDRMSVELSGVTGTWVPGVSVTLNVTKSANIPLTGICDAGCVTWVGDQQSKIRVTAGRPSVIPAP